MTDGWFSLAAKAAASRQEQHTRTRAHKKKIKKTGAAERIKAHLLQLLVLFLQLLFLPLQLARLLFVCLDKLLVLLVLNAGSQQRLGGQG